MNALQDAVKHILLSADNESDRKWGKDAAVELAAMQEAIEAAREFVREYLSEEICCDCLGVLPKHDDSFGVCKAGKLASIIAALEAK